MSSLREGAGETNRALAAPGSSSGRVAGDLCRDARAGLPERAATDPEWVVHLPFSWLPAAALNPRMRLVRNERYGYCAGIQKR